MPFVGQLVEDAAQKLRGHHLLGSWVQFVEGHLAGAVDGHKMVLAALYGPDLGKIDGHRILIDGEYGRGRHRPHHGIRCGRAFTPFDNRFRIDAMAGG